MYTIGRTDLKCMRQKGVFSGGDLWRIVNAVTRERLRDQVLRGTLLVDTAGERVGQINGLAVMQLGGFAFGMPNRITARVRLGGGQVVDIEREARLGGPIHSKGVLILSAISLAATPSTIPCR